jgi:hypothetical protein
MKASTSSIPTLLSSSVAENDAPDPRRSGRVRTSTQRYESMAQPATSASRSSSKRKRSDTTHNNETSQQPDAKKTHAQFGVAKNKLKSITKRVANDRPAQSDDANAKPTTNSRPTRHVGNVIDLTEDEEATSSKKPKRSRSGEGEEKRLKL